MDYRPLDVISMFDECERRRCVNVAITQDLVDEDGELFTFHLRRTTGLSPCIGLDPVNGSIIVDDGEEHIMLCFNTYINDLRSLIISIKF